MEQMYVGKGAKFDPRTVFLVQSDSKLYLWVGSKCLGLRKLTYLDIAFRHAKNLQQYEKALQLMQLEQHNETEEFWSLWQMKQGVYQEMAEWDGWFVDSILEKSELVN